MLELRAQLEMDPSSSHRGGAEALRAKLQLVEDRVYQAADGVVADAVLQQWLNDFDKQKGRALMNTTAKQAANAEAGSAPRWKPRDDVKKTNKKYDNKHNDKKPTGGKGKEVMHWITEGCKLRWRTGPPPAFDHGVSLRDASLQQQQWLDEEKHRLLENGAWARATKRSRVSRAFLVPKPGTNKWRLVVDFRWLNQWCLKSKMRMETLKKPRRLAKPNDWNANKHSGMRVLPYMDDFLVLVDSFEDGLMQRERVRRVLNRLGLLRNEKKGQCDPVQVIEHLGLEVDLKHAKVDLEWWSRLPAMSKWNGRKIWRSPTRVKLHTDSSMMAWGGVLNLEHAARGFWWDEMREWHITHLELEAVFKTVQAFLRELEGKVVRLYCDNQAVVAMLSHFTSRNPDLMKRMRKLWSLLDLHDIELQARYIRSEANVWADNLSRCEDLDDWRLNRSWFEWANEQWGPFTVDRFASEISAQLPRYYTAWKDPQCEGVDSLPYDWRGENNWANPPWALLDQVAHKLREEEAAATVAAPYWPGQSWFRELEALATENFNDDGTAHVVYDDGDEETLNLSEEKFNILLCEGVNEQNKERGGDYKENKRGGETQNFFIRALCERWRSELGQSDYTDLAILMQRWSLLDSTLGNYGPKAERFVIFCVQRQRQWLPVTEATVLLYVASLLD
eukprot:gene2409-biopygen2328